MRNGQHNKKTKKNRATPRPDNAFKVELAQRAALRALQIAGARA